MSTLEGKRPWSGCAGSPASPAQVSDPTPLVSGPLSDACALKRVIVYQIPCSAEAQLTHFVTVVASAPTSGHLQLFPPQHRSPQHSC